jgi:hypothetical protein
MLLLFDRLVNNRNALHITMEHLRADYGAVVAR